jgi:hypothetical protein
MRGFGIFLILISAFLFNPNQAVAQNLVFPCEGGGTYSVSSGTLFKTTSCKGKVDISPIVDAIGTGAFKYTSEITEILIPNSVTYIGPSAFYGAEIESLLIPRSVTKIWGLAFAKAKINSIIFSGPVEFERFVFDFATISSVALPNSWQKIDDELFLDSNLMSIVIPNSVTRIGHSAFGRTKLKSIVIPNSVVSIGDNAFLLSTLESVTFGNSLSRVGGSAFAGTQLTSVVIPNSMTTIPALMFENTPLKSITIPNSVVSIEYGAFMNSKLVSVYLPISVKSIGDDAFASIPNLRVVGIPNAVLEVSEWAFDNSNPTSILYCGSLKITSPPPDRIKLAVSCKTENEKLALVTAAQEDFNQKLINPKVTITCVKGKLTKKVTAVKPKCPSGYKVKK